MEYPINARMAEIVETINNNVVTIVSAETGAGKSTQVPQAQIQIWTEDFWIETATSVAEMDLLLDFRKALKQKTTMLSIFSQCAPKFQLIM